jgi:hypothetical protein
VVHSETVDGTQVWLTRHLDVPQEQQTMATARTDGAPSTTATRLVRARAAGEQFCRKFSFSEQQIKLLAGEPIQAPLMLRRDGRQVEVFRWLGHGRGSAIVQVEIGVTDDAVTVFGGLGHGELGPWTPGSTPK